MNKLIVLASVVLVATLASCGTDLPFPGEGEGEGEGFSVGVPSTLMQGLCGNAQCTSHEPQADIDVLTSTGSVGLTSDIPGISSANSSAAFILDETFFHNVGAGTANTCVCHDQAKAMQIAGDFGKSWHVALRNTNVSACTDTDPPTTYDEVVVRRYNVDGSLDTGWSSTNKGRVLTLPSGNADDFISITADNNNNLYVVSKIVSGSATEFRIQKFGSTGSLDTSFGTSGVVSMGAGFCPNDFSGITGGSDYGRSHLMYGSNKLLYLGVLPSNIGVYAIRFNLDGTKDTSFGNGDGCQAWSLSDLGLQTLDLHEGLTTVDPGSGKGVFALRVNHDHNSSTLDRLMLVRTVGASTSCTTAANCLDTNFSSDGINVFANGTDLTGSPSLFGVDAQGIIAVGIDEEVSSTDHDFWVYYVGDNGNFITSFNGTGRRQMTSALGNTNMGQKNNEATVAIDLSDEGVYVSGFTDDVYSSSQIIDPSLTGWVIRLTSGGARDSSFVNANGELTVHYLAGSMIYAADTSYVNNGGSTVNDTRMVVSANNDWVFVANAGLCPNVP